MPSAETVCTELSIGFGLLQRDPLVVAPDKAVKLWEGTLDERTFLDFIFKYQNNSDYYRQFYNIGVELAHSHRVLARSKIYTARWEGPRRQARTVSLPKDIIVANVPISVKANSNVVANPSPHVLFVSLPNGESHRTKAENWYLQTGGEAYQNLYTFTRDILCPDFPANVVDYHNKVKGVDSKKLRELIKNLSIDDQKEFEELYNQFCHVVAESSASLFNSSLIKIDSSKRNSIFESVMRLFFRLGDTEYVLCGLDCNKGFSVIVPDLSNWMRNWRLKRITAIPDLTREQSVVNFEVSFEEKATKKETEVKFHSEIRWSHGKFKGNPEAKLYKEFEWTNISFMEKIGSPRIQKIELIGSGGYGNVYRAKDIDSGKEVALKEYIAQGNDIDQSRFEREVQL